MEVSFAQKILTANTHTAPKKSKSQNIKERSKSPKLTQNENHLKADRATFEGMSAKKK